METVSVANLKQRLSHYLGLVKEGQEVVVTAHRRPIARVIAAEAALCIRPASRPVKALAGVGGVRLASRADVVAVLLEDRARR